MWNWAIVSGEYPQMSRDMLRRVKPYGTASEEYEAWNNALAYPRPNVMASIAVWKE